MLEASITRRSLAPAEPVKLQMDEGVLTELARGQGDWRFGTPFGVPQGVPPRRAMIDYIHANPVRRGLVAQVEDWEWSSAGWYAGLRSVKLEMDEGALTELARG